MNVATTCILHVIFICYIICYMHLLHVIFACACNRLYIFFISGLQLELAQKLKGGGLEKTFTFASELLLSGHG